MHEPLESMLSLDTGRMGVKCGDKLCRDEFSAGLRSDVGCGGEVCPAVRLVGVVLLAA
jgi:hypothetical protein